MSIRSSSMAAGAGPRRLLAMLCSALGASLLLALTMGLMAVFFQAQPQPAAALTAASANVITHTTVSDFAVCRWLTGAVPTPMLTDSSVSSADGGELRLAAIVEDYFDGDEVDTSQWLADTVYDWYVAPQTVAGGVITLDGNYLRSLQVFTQSARFFESSALVRADSRDSGRPDLGYYRELPPLDPQSVTETSAIRLFVVGNGDPNNMHIRWRDGLYPPLPEGDIDIADPNPFQFHVYRIEWEPTETRFYIDGALKTTVTGTSALKSWVWLYHQTPVGAYNVSPMQVDWVRAGQYASTGQYVSCVQDAGQSVEWGPIGWDADVPAGGSLAFRTRTSADGNTWSAWSAPITVQGSNLQNSTGRYLQYKVEMSTTNPLVSPQVNAVSFRAPLLSFSSSTYQVSEANTQVTITATLGAALSEMATVEYVTANGTATAGSDYTAASGSLTFMPGTTVQTFTVPILNDVLDEDDETVLLSFRNPNKLGLGTPETAQLIILDNDVMPTLAYTVSAKTVGEAVGSIVVTFTLDAPSGRNVLIDTATPSGTATAGSDYGDRTGTLIIPPGVTAITLPLNIIDDALDENDETFTLLLSNIRNAVMGDNAETSVTFTIIDNDPLPTVQFSASTYSFGEGAGTATITATLSAASGRAVTVTYGTSNGTATAGSDYTATTGALVFPAGQVSRTFAVAIANDVVDELDETVTLTLSSPSNATLAAPSTATLTIVDNDPPPAVAFGSAQYSAGEGAGTATITVTLDAPSSRVVTVTYGTSNGTATAGSDYTSTTGSLVFAAGQTSKTFTVGIKEDAIAEADETVTLTLSNPENATLGANNPAVLKIVDNDTLPTVQFVTTDYSVAEGKGTATITVTLSHAYSAAVTVKYTSSDGTAEAGSDYTAASGTLTVPTGQVSRTWTVTIVNDRRDEPDEMVNLTLSDPVNAVLGVPSTAVLTIVDDDYNVFLPVLLK